eukprot:scaffold71110_cov27-Tisochrysis_lutea.AAC.1
MGEGTLPSPPSFQPHLMRAGNRSSEGATCASEVPFLSAGTPPFWYETIPIPASTLWSLGEVERGSATPPERGLSPPSGQVSVGGSWRGGAGY